jgi:hypothetical protein
MEWSFIETEIISLNFTGEDKAMCVLITLNELTIKNQFPSTGLKLLH